MRRSSLAACPLLAALVLCGQMPLAHAAPPAPRGSAAPSQSSGWLGESLPLPLAVKSPADLAVKGMAERLYLTFNLLAGGKVAFDAGDFPTAARKWESLLALPGLDPEINRVIRPMADEARRRAGGAPASQVVVPAYGVPAVAAPPANSTPGAEPASGATAGSPGAATVRGTITGGGAIGPGGTVVWLKRKDGATPRPRPVRGAVMNQVDKQFTPHVLPVTVGSKVAFHNQDVIYHNVFSLSRPNEFDSGLFKAGMTYDRTFSKPGPVQMLCNIHSSMLAYIVVVDSPWYGQAGRNGEVIIKRVPPGEYELFAWHEASSGMTRHDVSVSAEGARPFTVQVGSDVKRPKFVPDKYGKPRQGQLGY